MLVMKIYKLPVWLTQLVGRGGVGGSGVWSGGRVGLVVGQGGWERRIEVFVKIQKKNWGRGSGRGVPGVGLGGQGGCDRRIEVFGKIHTKNWGGVEVVGWVGVGVGSGWGSGWLDKKKE